MKHLVLALLLATLAAPAAAQHASDPAAPASYTLGALTLTAPYSRATLPNAPVGGGFLTITNTGTEDDVLLSAASPAAGHMEVHEMKMEGEVMKMRELADGLPIPAGATVELKPGGYHLMLMELKDRLVEGETVAVTLTFATAGTIEIPFAIGAPNARGADGHAGHGMGHGN